RRASGHCQGVGSGRDHGRRGMGTSLDLRHRLLAEGARNRKSPGSEGVCLACGKEGALLKTVPDMVKGSLIPVGTDTTGRPKQGRDAALVSVNTPAQGRGGTLQLANTPLCEDCGVQTVASLNRLLADERHRRRGDDSVLT